MLHTLTCVASSTTAFFSMLTSSSSGPSVSMSIGLPDPIESTYTTNCSTGRERKVNHKQSHHPIYRFVRGASFKQNFSQWLLNIHFPTIHPVTFHLLLPHIHKRKEKLETLFPFFSVGVFVKTPTDVHHQNIKPCLIRTEIPCKPLRGLQHCENC